MQEYRDRLPLIRSVMRSVALVATLAAALVCAGLVSAQDLPARPAGLNLIPWPKSLKMHDGRLKLTAGSRIVATSNDLNPLAAILSDEIYMVTGRRLATATGEGKAGDIVLKVNKGLKSDADIFTVQNNKFVYTRDYAHTITVTDRAVVEGFDYRATAEGSATVLQALIVDGDQLALPGLEGKDWPQADFMAIMVDLGRQYISPEALKQTIQACRFYKVRYLHMHLSDDQGFTFPSKAFPRLGSRNTAAHGGIPPRVYTMKELTDLVAFAGVRGVTLVPELETPGHSTALRLAMPELFDAPKEQGGEAWIAAMNMANDKMYPALDTLVGEICEVFKSSPYFHIGCDETQLGILAELPSTRDYMAKHKMAGVHELFSQHITRMSQFAAKRGKKTIVWEGAAVTSPMTNDVIVMTWEGSAQSAARYVAAGFTTITVPWGLSVPLVEWNMYICNGSFLKRSDRVIGALLPMWEMSTDALVSAYLKGIPVRHERTWGPDNVFAEEEINRRSTATEARLSSLIRTVDIKADGLRAPGGNIFDGQLTITLSSTIKNAPVRYMLDGSVPTAASTLYTGPIKIADSTRITAAVFNHDGSIMGYASSASFIWSQKEINLTTGRPVTASGVEAACIPTNAVDGLVLLDTAWWANPYPQWIKIDLGQIHTLDRATIFPYWDGNRYYQYNVELSADGEAWKQVVDMSTNTTPSSSKGHSSVFKPTPGRYVRVNMLKNSANMGVHLVEVRVYEAGK